MAVIEEITELVLNLADSREAASTKPKYVWSMPRERVLQFGERLDYALRTDQRRAPSKRARKELVRKQRALFDGEVRDALRSTVPLTDEQRVRLQAYLALPVWRGRFDTFRPDSRVSGVVAYLDGEQVIVAVYRVSADLPSLDRFDMWK